MTIYQKHAQLQIAINHAKCEDDPELVEQLEIDLTDLEMLFDEDDNDYPLYLR